MTASNLPVVVIGAGPTGLMTALCLAKSGIPVRILEKTHEFHRMSRGSGLHPRTLEYLHILGLLEDFERLIVDMPPARAYKLPGGTEVAREWDILEKPTKTPDRPYGLAMISQFQNEDILREHLAALGIRPEMGCEPQSIEQNDTAVVVTVRKTNADGTAAGEEKIHAAYVVGADGAKGMSRKTIGATFEGKTVDEDGGVWFQADVEGDGLSSNYWHMWIIPGKATVMLRPEGTNGGFLIGVVGKNFDPAEELMDYDAAIAFFRENTGRTDLVFRNMHSLFHWKPKMLMVNKYSEGRVFIAGDAAHIHSPTGGQGLNTCVADGINLAWKIALAHKGLATADLLTSYHTERHPIAAEVIRISSSLYVQTVATSAEDINVPVTAEESKKGGLIRWRVAGLSQLEINYRWSPVVYDARGPAGLSEAEMRAYAYTGYGPGAEVRAGDRAPEAPGLVDAAGKATSLFAIFKPDAHTVLVSCADTGDATIVDVVDAVKALPAGLAVRVVAIGSSVVPNVEREVEGVYHDGAGWFGRAYGLMGGAPPVVVVRPDGYIGAFANDAAGLREYFSKIVVM
ncbi:FAD binding domain-containing protein [Epithele typhae]|uniref:FAD binding domain-containing protein n=1 Tax=Epithele typhae TaxID=378194 RepID=UPI0020082579|nr:FAD binding domain-containing protein [Epithele typhae]KAH9915188.1 FAD binding domain-containing protein [Epithele typhae]